MPRGHCGKLALAALALENNLMQGLYGLAYIFGIIFHEVCTMGSIFGKNIRVSIFGESHGAAIGCAIDGFPAGLAVDFAALAAFMARRAPGATAGSTPRREADAPEFLSGIANGRTTGTPIAAIIRNSDQHSGDYAAIAATPRPGHADLAQRMRYGDSCDLRGGGHASGRLTAPLCIAGGLALQWLAQRGISIAARIDAIHGHPISGERDASGLDAAARAEIEAARAAGDSVGGIIACEIKGVPPGVGSPIFDGLENRIAAAVFGIPAVKGIEFGNGFEAATLLGSENNDAFALDGEKVVTATNRHGGILGGISSGMPITFRVAIKPTPSIAKAQRTVDVSKHEECEIRVPGRHDACIVPRAVPVVEAAAAIAVMDGVVVSS